MTYNLQTRFFLDVMKSSLGVADEEGSTTIEPGLMSVKWTRNNHHEADILTVSVGYKECGVEPRQLINARCFFAAWDGNKEDFDPKKHVRFTGICKTAERKFNGKERVVDMTFHDFTTLFLAMKPLKPEGIPEWTDSLRSAWVRICDNTGWEDPANGKIVSTVKIFTRPDGIQFFPPELQARLLGEMVSPRFQAISKPTPPQRCDAWACWRWICESLGLITFINQDVCEVHDTNEFYNILDAPVAIYGENVVEFEEKSDTTLTAKGILLKSFDPLQGRMIESFYPKPGDPRIKTPRSAAGKKSEAGATVTANEVSGQYDEYEMHSITDQAVLDAKAQAAFEERSRQELTGKLVIVDLVLPGNDGRDVDVMNLRSGDGIMLKVDPENLETLLSFPDESSRVNYLTNVVGYDVQLATLIAKNAVVPQLHAPLFHINDISFEYSNEKCESEISFHNIIVTG